MKRKFLFAAISAFMLILAAFTTASAQDITITVNGNTVETDTAPVIINERTMVPLRAISNALNCGVGWNGTTQGITIIQAPVNGSNEHLIACWIGRDHAFALDGLALGNTYVMDSVPVIVNERTLVPIRAISELLGAQVDWDAKTQTVIITADMPSEPTSDYVAEDLSGYEATLYNLYDVYADYADGHPNTINAEIGLEKGGVIKLELYPDIAPTTVENFVTLAKNKAFDGTIFHRVIRDFMIQGGAVEPDGNMRNANSIPGEFIANGFMNLIPHDRGVLSTARTNDPDSASNQFFIMHKKTPSLDGQYAAFGKVTSGMEYVDEIAVSQTDTNDKPIENQIISYIKIIE